MKITSIFPIAAVSAVVARSMGTHAAAPAQYPNLKYDPANDFTAIGQTAEAQTKVNEAHAGVGSQSHTYCTLLQSTMGTKTARIAYRGSVPLINDLVGGSGRFQLRLPQLGRFADSGWLYQGNRHCQPRARRRDQRRADLQRGRSSRVPGFGVECNLRPEESAARYPKSN